MTPAAFPELLLVEDNPDDMELTLRALRRNGLEQPVHVVRDGAEAVGYLLDEASGTIRPLPKVVLLDLKLPKVGGFEVLARIRADERTRRLPVVVVSSSSEEPDVREAYRLGASSYVVKPVEFEELVRSVGFVGRYWLTLNRSPA